MLSAHFMPVLLPQASFVSFLDTMEKNSRFGVEFFRSFTGLITDGEIREITQSDLDPILRVNLARLLDNSGCRISLRFWFSSRRRLSTPERRAKRGGGDGRAELAGG